MNALPDKLKLYIIPTTLTGIGITVWILAGNDQWSWWFLVPGVIAAITQLFKVESVPEKTNHNIGWMVYGFTLVLLGAPAALLVIIIANLVEWVWRRYSWYIPFYNIATYALGVYASQLVLEWINPKNQAITLRGTLGILGAIAAFTLVNRFLTGVLNWLSDGKNVRNSGSLSLFGLMVDYTLICLGSAAAFIWMISPSAAIFSIIPLYLIVITFKVPALRRQAQVDPKTGLYDSRFLTEALNKELKRAKRFDRPLSIVIGDLDLLRIINNTYGHLAGDAILCGVADILQKSFRGYDIVARFGGEEFAILMPETDLEEAYLRIEEVRESIETASFEVSTSVTPIHITISFGLAAREGDNQSSSDLIHNADVALYDAKVSGRNLTRIYSNNNVDYLFGLRVAKDLGKFNEGGIVNQSEPFDPGPLPDKSKLQAIEPTEDPNRKRKLQPWWIIYSYVGVMAAFALLLVIYTFKPMLPKDWMGLGLFVMIVVFTEILSVEVYLKDASISTSAAPILAGVLLFGPLGAVILSIVVSVTSYIKKGGYLHRFIFDLSSQLIACFLCAGIIFLIKTPIISLPQPLQIALGVVAGIVVFIVNTWLQSGIISLSVGSPILQVWKEQFRWLWPYYLAFGVVAYALILGYSFAGVIGVLAIMVPLLTLRLGQIQYVNRTRDVVNKLRANNEKLEKQGDEITILNEELLLSLAKSIDLRDPYTMGHSQQVTNYAMMIAKELNLPQEQVETVRKGSMLHDIGKLGVPDTILLKQGRLTPEEYEVIKNHPLLGAQILESSRNLRELIPLVRHHHERFDGKGYPDGLVGHAIPIEARILTLADSIEAMASDRPYRRGLTLEEIIEEVRRVSGEQFDPRLVKIFLKLVEAKGDRIIVNSARKVDLGEIQQYKASLGLEYGWRAGD